MDGVDRADQMRATNASWQKETRLSMTLFHFLFDICLLNASQVYKNLYHMRLVFVVGTRQ